MNLDITRTMSLQNAYENTFALFYFQLNEVKRFFDLWLYQAKNLTFGS